MAYALNSETGGSDAFFLICFACLQAAEDCSYVFDFEKLSKRDLNKIEKAMNKYRAKCSEDAGDASSGKDDSEEESEENGGG
eukprot:954026-Rhodomonas_salina.1